MTAVGPELARALGGTWDAGTGRVNLPGGGDIWAGVSGNVYALLGGRYDDLHHIGSLSDGADVLAARARELGAGT